MNKKECIELMMKYLKTKSYLNAYKDLDFNLKSHIFYYQEIFKEVKKIKIMNVSSIHEKDSIDFDVYYLSEAVEGLFHGFFEISPNNDTTKEIFKNVSMLCTSLDEYFYYLFKNSPVFKLYLISGSIDSALEQGKEESLDMSYKKYKMDTYKEISQYKTEELIDLILEKKLTKKYIINFINMNKKCSENVRTFLLNILSEEYIHKVCILNDIQDIKRYIHVDTQNVYLNKYSELSPYGFLSYIKKEEGIIFLKLEYDFEGR